MALHLAADDGSGEGESAAAGPLQEKKLQTGIWHCTV
jgi:hypothetical protein